MISPMGLPVDKVNYHIVCKNIHILATRALFVMKFSPYTDKVTYIMISFELFSNLIPIRKILPLNLNKGFIEPPCICEFKVKFTPMLHVWRSHCNGGLLRCTCRDGWRQICIDPIKHNLRPRVVVNDSQLAKLKNSVPVMLLP